MTDTPTTTTATPTTTDEYSGFRRLTEAHGILCALRDEMTGGIASFRQIDDALINITEATVWFARRDPHQKALIKEASERGRQRRSR